MRFVIDIVSYCVCPYFGTMNKLKHNNNMLLTHTHTHTQAVILLASVNEGLLIFLFLGE